MADKSLSLSLSHTLLVLVSSTLIYAGIFSYFLYILHIFTFIHAVQCGVCAICAIDTICSSYSYLQLSATAERNKNRRRNTLWNVLNFCFGQKKEAKTLQQQLNNFLTHCCPWKVHKFAISFYTHRERQFLLFLTAVKYLYKNRQQLQAKRGDDYDAVCRWLMSAHFNR